MEESFLNSFKVDNVARSGIIKSKRIDAGALYFSIVVAFFIAILSASIIMLVAHYRNSYLKELRFQRLINNIESGIVIALAQSDINANHMGIDLYNDRTDSLEITKTNWGVFELVNLRSSINEDTLKKVFLTAHNPDSTGEVLYLADEDRPVSVSGDTRITGNVRLPKSGIRKAFAEGRAFSGDEPVNGLIKDSGRRLPALDEVWLSSLKQNLEKKINELPVLPGNEVINSFHNNPESYRIPDGVSVEGKLAGAIFLYADTLVKITAGSTLNNVVLYAPAIIVEKGFNGACQLFARDSVIIGEAANFQYPSAIGIIKSDTAKYQTKIVLGKKVTFNGVIFSWEKDLSTVQNIVEIGEGASVFGELYSKGMVKLAKGSHIMGMVSCNRFIMKTPSTLYENFLIDVEFNRKKRSRYYLSPGLTSMQNTKKILKWLD